MLITIHTRGFIAHDEGLMVNPALRLLNGETAYKDFQFYYFPGTLLFYAPILFLFKSILALRLAAVVVSSISVLLIFRTTFLISKNRFFSYIGAFIFLLFGPFTINFLSPTMLAIPCCLAALYFILKKKSSHALFFSGVFTGLALVFKQNLAAAVFIAILFSILLMSLNRIVRLKKYLFGFSLPIIFAGLFLFLTGALPAFLYGIYYFIYEKTILLGLQVTPFIQPDSPIKMFLKFIVYTFPFWVSLGAIYVSFKNKKQLLSVGVFSLFFYLFGIRPTTDYIHLAPILSLSALPLAVILFHAKTELTKIVIYMLCLLLLSVGILNVGYRHYYRWDSPLKTHTIFINLPRVLLFGNVMAEKSIKEIQKILQENPSSNKYVFIYGFMPMYYFMTDTKNPTRFDFLPPLSRTEEKEIVNNLLDKEVNLILTLNDITDDKSLLGSFIKENYKLKRYPVFYVWKKS